MAVYFSKKIINLLLITEMNKSDQGSLFTGPIGFINTSQLMFLNFLIESFFVVLTFKLICYQNKQGNLQTKSSKESMHLQFNCILISTTALRFK